MKSVIRLVIFIACIALLLITAFFVLYVVDGRDVLTISEMPEIVGEVADTYEGTETACEEIDIFEGAVLLGDGDDAYVRSTDGYKWDPERNIDRSGVSNSVTEFDGKANTDWMLANTDLDETEETIWKFCADVREATGDDSWYIPSFAELKARYDRDSDFRPGFVWSSSESSDWPDRDAYSLNPYGNLSDKADIDSYRKDYPHYVVLFKASET